MLLVVVVVVEVVGFLVVVGNRNFGGDMRSRCKKFRMKRLRRCDSDIPGEFDIRQGGVCR